MRRLLTAVALALAAGPASAHHSLTGTYDSRHQQTIEGTVVEFQFVNPHPLVWLERDGDAGRRWRLEMDNRFELLGIGMTASTIRPGDRLVVTGSATRDGSPGLYVRRLERPADGFWYTQDGSSPKTGRH